MIAQAILLVGITCGTALWHAHKYCNTTDYVGQRVTEGLMALVVLVDVAFGVSILINLPQQ